jgi:hypothetical protein
MIAKLKVLAVAGLVSVVLANGASAFAWYCPPVPEFDGSSGIAVLALLLSLGAILRGNTRKPPQRT